jgi:hypothetical protein
MRRSPIFDLWLGLACLSTAPAASPAQFDIGPFARRRCAANRQTL